MNRPHYHFSPAKNWMNDPNGTVYRDGVYHLFYQYNPNCCEWGDINWAYAVSSNLVDWKRMGIRLSPENDRGEKHCFSGCAAEQGDGFVIAYTSVGPEKDAAKYSAIQRFACANSDFSEIVRLYDRDMTETAHPFRVEDWRDPFVFYFEGKPYLVLCTVHFGGEVKRNSVLLYGAEDGDLTRWKFRSVLFTDPENMIECPNVIVEGGKIALIYSTVTDRKVKYVSGDFDGAHLTERARGVVDWSEHCFYATNISKYARGGFVLYGWLCDDGAVFGGQSGCLALPRIVSFDGYRLRFKPIDEIYGYADGKLPAYNNEIISPSVCAAIKLNTTGDCVFTVTEGENENITVTVCGGELTVKRKSKVQGVCDRIEMAKISGETHSVEIFVDCSVLEIFVDGSAVISMRMYRSVQPEKLFSLKNGNVEIVDAFNIRAACITGE